MARKPAIIEATPEHVEAIASRVRPADARELASLFLSPDRALRISLRTALAAWTGTVDGVPVCMFGVSPGEMMEGRPWMIGTSDLDEFATIFLRRCRRQVDRMLQIRPVLVNYVSADNARAIEWLTWLGFTIEAPIPWGPRGALFHRFSMRRKSMTEIKPCTFAEVAASGLLSLYADECAIDGLPRPAADPEKYEGMIGTGAMKALGSYRDGVLVGFVAVMLIPTPHYCGRCIAVTESIYVHPEHRAGGTGHKLLKAAESVAVENLAIGLMVSAPAGSNLSKIMKATDSYRLTNEVFIRGFA